MIKKIIFYGLVFIFLVGLTRIPGDGGIKERLQDYFFGLSIDSSFASVKQQLLRNPDFKLYEDPNRDANISIIGSVLKDKDLNPGAIRNQITILFAPQQNKTKIKVTFKWSIEYKLEDLAIALNDWGKLKTEFKPFFSDISEKKEIGYHQEQIESLYLKKGMMTVTIRLLEYNNSSHTVSLEYTDIKKNNQGE